jgi:hypothetical protein
MLSDDDERRRGRRDRGLRQGHPARLDALPDRPGPYADRRFRVGRRWVEADRLAPLAERDQRPTLADERDQRRDVVEVRRSQGVAALPSPGAAHSGSWDGFR